MSYLLTGIIAVILTALALMAGVSYYDSSSVGSTALAKTIEAKLGHASEAAANYTATEKVRPASLDDLKGEGLPSVDGPEGIGIPGAEWAMTCQGGDCQTGVMLCIEMPDSPEAESAATSAAGKMGGVASGACGSTDPFGSQVSVGIALK